MKLVGLNSNFKNESRVQKKHIFCPNQADMATLRRCSYPASYYLNFNGIKSFDPKLFLGDLPE